MFYERRFNNETVFFFKYVNRALLETSAKNHQEQTEDCEDKRKTREVKSGRGGLVLASAVQ